MKKSSKIFLSGVGGLFVMLLIMAIPFNGLNAAQKVVGNDKSITKETTLTSFENVNVSGNFDVTIKQGKRSNISITTDENIMPYIQMVVSNNALNLDVKPGITIFSSESQKAVITNPTVKNIQVTGNTKLQAKDIKEDALKLTLSGNGEVHLAGEVKKLTVDLKGNAKVNAKDLKADTVIITGAGNVDLSVHAVKYLDVNAFGKINVQYAGNPEISRTVFGFITIQKLGK